MKVPVRNTVAMGFLAAAVGAVTSIALQRLGVPAFPGDTVLFASGCALLAAACAIDWKSAMKIWLEVDDDSQG